MKDQEHPEVVETILNDAGFSTDIKLHTPRNGETETRVYAGLNRRVFISEIKNALPFELNDKNFKRINKNTIAIRFPH